MSAVNTDSHYIILIFEGNFNINKTINKNSLYLKKEDMSHSSDSYPLKFIYSGDAELSFYDR